MTLLASDDFNRADESPLYGGGNWLTGGTNLALVSDKVTLPSSWLLDVGANSWWNGVQPPNIWVEIDIVNASLFGHSEHEEINLFARSTIAGTISAIFYAGRDFPTVYLSGYSGGLITGYPTWSFTNGDRVGLKCNGNRIDLTKNGSVIFTAFDPPSDGISGKVGIGILPESNNDGGAGGDAGVLLDNFTVKSINKYKFQTSLV